MSNQVKALALDGGGIRGYISALILSDIEKKLAKKLKIPNKNLEKENILKDHFDVIAGTSTGSILAAAIGVGMPIGQVIKIYEERAETIFPNGLSYFADKVGSIFHNGASSPKYDDAGLEAELMRELKGIKLGDLKTTVLIQAYDATNHHPVVFKSNSDPTRSSTKSYERTMQSLPLWEIVKASSSAPVYFPSHTMLAIPGTPVGDTKYFSVNDVKFDSKLSKKPIFKNLEQFELAGRKGFVEVAMIDGGVFANNPSIVALAELFSRHRDEDVVLVSVGTGESAVQPISSHDGTEWGGLEWVKHLIDVFMGGASSHVHNLADRVLSDNYFRFEVLLDDDYPMDNSKAAFIDKMQRVANQYLSGDKTCDARHSKVGYCYSENVANLIKCF